MLRVIGKVNNVHEIQNMLNIVLLFCLTLGWLQTRVTHFCHIHHSLKVHNVMLKCHSNVISLFKLGTTLWLMNFKSPYKKRPF
jgi:hypothetical protein